MSTPRLRFIGLVEQNSQTKNTRPITVIGGIPFYCSTGENSHQSDTWFPCTAFTIFPLGLQKPGMLTETKVDLCFPKQIYQWLQKKAPSLIPRFGNFEAMCLSMLIAEKTGKESFWTTPDGEKLKGLVNQDYQQEITELKTVFAKELDCFSRKIKIEKEFKPASNNRGENLKKNQTISSNINKWLSENGSIYDEKKKQPIDFLYDGFRCAERENERRRQNNHNSNHSPNKNNNIAKQEKPSGFIESIAQLPGWQRFIVGAAIGLGVFIGLAALATGVGALVAVAAPAAGVGIVTTALVAAPLFTGLMATAGALCTAIIFGTVTATADVEMQAPNAKSVMKPNVTLGQGEKKIEITPSKIPSTTASLQTRFADSPGASSRSSASSGSDQSLLYAQSDSDYPNTFGIGNDRDEQVQRDPGITAVIPEAPTTVRQEESQSLNAFTPGLKS